LECDFRQLEALDTVPRVREELALINTPSLTALPGELMLYGESMRQALSYLPRLSGHSLDFASTDFRPYLEYQTPKGNAVPYNTVPHNVYFMQRLRAVEPVPPDLPIRNLPSENERNLIQGYAAAQRGDIRAALECLRRVEGPARARAQAAITRIESGERTQAP
jgi:hypothetical protein